MRTESILSRKTARGTLRSSQRVRRCGTIDGEEHKIKLEVENEKKIRIFYQFCADGGAACRMYYHARPTDSSNTGSHRTDDAGTHGDGNTGSYRADSAGACGGNIVV